MNMETATRGRSASMEKLLSLRLHSPPRARRRLFPAEDDQTTDNFENILQESRIRDLNNMKEKWNFDFDHEEPLDGKYQWFKLDDNNWISMEPNVESRTKQEHFDEDNFEKENHVTPRINKSDVLPVIRKRKRDEDKHVNTVSDKGAKRKITFE